MDRLRVAALVMASCTAGIAPAAEAARFEVENHTDIAYRTDANADKERHKLDIFVPKGAKDFPVLVFVHGGAWQWGNKSLYAPLGKAFASVGIGTVVINYRLTPQVQHPSHVEDVARAFAWTAENIGKYGGRADRIFISGHSAGGHLASLLALDETYLKAVGHTVREVRGVLSISGVYSIMPELSFFHSIFGKDPAVCKNASPISHIQGKHPPFLIVYAEKDIPGLDTNAKDMHAALTKAASETKLREIKDRNHISIIVGGVLTTDVLTTAMRDFVTDHMK
jgi:acetyl esterase/lipase